MRKDGRFLLITFSIIAILISFNFPGFLKSLIAQNLANSWLRQNAAKLQYQGLRKQEQEIWHRLKEVNNDNPENDLEIIVPKPTPAPVKLNTKPLKIAKQKPYQKFLFVGDSIIYEVGISTQNTLLTKYQIKNTKLDYKISTGLNRTDVYNWYTRTDKLLKLYQPDVVIVMFGGNDDQDIQDFEGKYSLALTEAWKKAYRQRVEKYAQLINKSSVRKVYWIGQPITNRQRYNIFFPIFNQTYKAVSQSSPKFKFISTWERMSLNGKYAPILANQLGEKGYVKADDGVHLTPHGASIISELIINQMEKDKVIKRPVKKPNKIKK